MDRRAINFNGLRAFEAAARHLSIARGADELHVTRAAVSHRVRILETRLGVNLFQRTRRGVRLTAAGKTLLPVLEDALDRISRALETIRKSPDNQILTVSTTPCFATRWLVPRLSTLDGPSAGRFEIHLRPTLHILDVAHGEIDVAIRCGTPPWPGLKAELLSAVHMAPVCSPALLEGRRLPIAPADVFDYTLLHGDVGIIPIGSEWRAWLHAAGLGNRSSLTGFSFQDPSLAVDAAIAGAGFAIGYVELLDAELASGRLIRPFELSVRHPFSYYLVYAQARENEPTIVKFREWIMESSRNCREGRGRVRDRD